MAQVQVSSRVGFIASVNGVTVDKNDFRILLRAKIILLAGARNVMAPMHHRLHPAQPGIARWLICSLVNAVCGSVTNESPPW